MFTESSNQEIEEPKTEFLDTLIAHELSKPLSAGPNDDTQVIDLSDTQILKEISKMREIAKAEVLRESSNKEDEIDLKNLYNGTYREVSDAYLKALDYEV